jgi:tetratricopeptide (TPR) repeat protein
MLAFPISVRNLGLGSVTRMLRLSLSSVLAPSAATRRWLISSLSLSLLLSIGSGSSFASQNGSHAKSASTKSQSKSQSKTMPVTAGSDHARELYEKGMDDYEKLYLERCNDDWRAAVKEDPTLALAWAWIAFNSRDTAEVTAAREKAKGLVAKITPGEQLMVEWIVKVQEGDYLGGIASMNDMLALYPKDRRLLYLAGNWLMGENGDDQALRLFQKSIALDKNDAPALNNLAYLYARKRDFPQAFAMMDRYTQLFPKEPNPNDSYGELLRMAGNFDGSLAHYRAALKIDPTFVTSQVGIADTYALMGNQQQARVEYDKAIEQAHNEADRIDYMMQKAVTYVRDGNLAEADKAFEAAAEKAHGEGLDLQESAAHQRMSEYQTEDATALHHLEAAEKALSCRADLPVLDSNQQLARILRLRAIRASHAGNTELATKAIKQLETMASTSRDLVIQSAFHGAEGSLLATQGKYEDAIPHLEEDQDDPFSLELLSKAYYEQGSSEKMHAVEAKLRATNVPTIEQALVVPAARSRKPATS